ncbi:Uncharacterized protein GBIM_12913 [Gryllus bimaculatus]|nr:Uncharacterized protein GBIM_12913 [Gryllus bimaculatus]
MEWVNDSHMAFPGSWHDVILTPRNTDTFTHVMSYTIRGLPRASMFEAIVQAKNRYGWNEVSDMFQFYTRGAGEYDSGMGQREPEMAERELSAANLSNSGPLRGPPRRTAAAAAALRSRLRPRVRPRPGRWRWRRSRPSSHHRRRRRPTAAARSL